MASSQLPSIAELRQLLRYEPETGRLFWRERPEQMFANRSRRARHLCASWNTRYAGSPALHYLNNRGYYSGAVFSARLLSHRVIWAIVHGEWPEFIDHINGDRADNRLCNLRAVSRVENNHNRRLNHNNVSGVCGVKQLPNGRWSARIRHDSKNKWLGTFDTMEAAAEARLNAQAELGFHANHGRVL